MAKNKPGKKDLECYLIKGTNNIVRRLDSAVYLRIYLLEYAFVDCVFIPFPFLAVVFATIAILAFTIMIPVNWTSGSLRLSNLTYSNIDILSISNIPTGSLRFWTHLIMAYAFNTRICYSLEKEYANAARMTLHFLASENRCLDQFTDFRLNEKRWDSKRLLDSSGMPSSHAATVTALAMEIGLQEGTKRSEFAIAIVLAGVVIGKLKYAFRSDHPLASVRPLRELLGHTPVQVIAGATVGFIVAYLMRNTD